MKNNHNNKDIKLLIQELNNILNQWDFIGVHPFNDGPTDEYDCLIGPIISRLNANSTNEELKNFLIKELNDHFGMPSLQIESIDDVVEKITAWWNKKDITTKIINLPSVNSEGCNTILKFHQKKYEIIPWFVEIESCSPLFKGKLNLQLENDEVIRFVNDLKIIEKERKGQCQLASEYGFSLTIQSIDSVGHFSINVAMWINRGYEENDSLNISYEIEPSLLITLLEDFNNLTF